VGGMITTTFAILIVVPVIASFGLVTVARMEGEIEQ